VYFLQGQSLQYNHQIQETKNDTLMLSSSQNYMLHFIVETSNLCFQRIFRSFLDFHGLGSFAYYRPVILDNFPQYGVVLSFLRIRFSLIHFLKKDLLILVREREHELLRASGVRGRGRGKENLKQTPSSAQSRGFDPTTPRSRPELKHWMLNRLSHPGTRQIIFF